MAIPSLTEAELRAALESLDAFKNAGLRSSRFDPELPTGKTVSFQKAEDTSEWVMK